MQRPDFQIVPEFLNAESRLQGNCAAKPPLSAERDRPGAVFGAGEHAFRTSELIEVNLRGRPIAILIATNRAVELLSGAVESKRTDSPEISTEGRVTG